ncbi:DASH complex subunit Spc19p [Trichomonascus vanleenenianus]|uniref:Spc19p n=1 Tax=Trichomonascus vanleenenianus TaxID=2268995 RepID=UPI003ECB74BB
MDSYNLSLSNSVNSLNSALSILQSSNENLNQVQDFGRLPTVLKTNKVFDIVTESEINEGKRELAAETEPQVMALLRKAEQEIARLERKERSLSSKAELQRIRLEQVSNVTNVGSDLQERIERLRMLQREKERLSYSLSRLNLKQRKARMSMAFQRQP